MCCHLSLYSDLSFDIYFELVQGLIRIIVNPIGQNPRTAIESRSSAGLERYTDNVDGRQFESARDYRDICEVIRSTTSFM